MSRVLIPSRGPSDWKGLLADPEKHWRRGKPAFETAMSWEAAQATPRGLPPAIAAQLDTQPALAGATALVVLPEHKVKLAAPGRASQNDVWTLLRVGDALVSMAVEGKAGETFGEPLGDWLKDASLGKLQRLESLCALLGATNPPEGRLRYQLFHRTASALIEAERFGATHAVMIVQSFLDDPVSLADYVAFGAALGASVAKDQLIATPRAAGPTLYLGWASCAPASDSKVAAMRAKEARQQQGLTSDDGPDLGSPR